MSRAASSSFVVGVSCHRACPVSRQVLLLSFDLQRLQVCPFSLIAPLLRVVTQPATRPLRPPTTQTEVFPLRDTYTYARVSTRAPFLASFSEFFLSLPLQDPARLSIYVKHRRIRRPTSTRRHPNKSISERVVGRTTGGCVFNVHSLRSTGIEFVSRYGRRVLT